MAIPGSYWIFSAKVERMGDSTWGSHRVKLYPKPATERLFKQYGRQGGLHIHAGKWGHTNGCIRTTEKGLLFLVNWLKGDVVMSVDVVYPAGRGYTPTGWSNDAGGV